MIAAGAKKNENRNDRRNDRAKMIAAALKIDRNEMIAKWSLLALKIDSTCSNSNSEGASNLGFWVVFGVSERSQ